MGWRFVVAAGLLGLSGPAIGAYWKTVSVTPERTVYADMDSIERTGDTVRTWERAVYSTAQSGETSVPYSSDKILMHYDCKARTYVPVLRVYFRDDGSEIRRVHLEGLQFPAAIDPDSLREKLLFLACRPEKASARQAAKAVAKPAAKTVAAAPDSMPGGTQPGSDASAPPVPVQPAAAKPTAVAAKAPVKPARKPARKKRAVVLAVAKPATPACPDPVVNQVLAREQPVVAAPGLTDPGGDGMFN